MLKLLKVGTDCELFVARNGEVIPIIGLLGGTKDAPIPVLGGQGFAVQEDNVLAEFNVPPADNEKEFAENVGKMMGYLNHWAKEKDLNLIVKASHNFPLEKLQHPQALTFGCEPDFDVWMRRPNPKPVCPKEMQGLRTAGGHIHVSFTEDGNPEYSPQIEDIEVLVRMMDFYLGAPSYFMDQDRDRTKLYGKPGAFRFKDYGFEYRTLSNFWLKDPGWVFRMVSRVFDDYNSGNSGSIVRASRVTNYLRTKGAGDKTFESYLAHYVRQWQLLPDKELKKLPTCPLTINQIDRLVSPFLIVNAPAPAILGMDVEMMEDPVDGGDDEDNEDHD